MAGAGPRRAVLTDVGGVLTSDVFAAFRAASTLVCGDPLLVERLLRQDEQSGKLLVEHECGRMPEADFEAGFAARLRAHGVPEVAPGLIAQIQAGLHLDETMLGAVRRLREHGVPVAIVSNALGDDGYKGIDLAELADVAVISSEVGVRKPSRRIYQIACERLGVEPRDCVLIDDLEQNLRGAARLDIGGILHRDAATTVRELADALGVPLA
ncbi:HAD family hydrolase [Actinomadura sp. CNU-125]|uniref:HAD family hydrolase n=1 Tax=Actinomadura sp. CNU-125 TaxID=1904961 RepID=UPI000963A0E1|nr:HAD family phosphatase [Actinomadura sp. CNU-125]OLT20835.1 HAD family hydrolase [Actinomadura sp. CNU-125]